MSSRRWMGALGLCAALGLLGPACGGPSGPTRVQLIKVDRSRFDAPASADLSALLCRDIEGWFAAAVLVELGEAALKTIVDNPPPACAAAQPRWWDRLARVLSLVGRYTEVSTKFRKVLLDFALKLSREAPSDELRGDFFIAAVDVNRFQGRIVLMEVAEAAIASNEITSANSRLRRALRAMWDLQRNPALATVLLDLLGKSPDPVIRYLTAMALGSVGEDEHLAALRTRLEQEADALARIGLQCCLYRRAGEANEDVTPHEEFLTTALRTARLPAEREALADCVGVTRLQAGEAGLAARLKTVDPDQPQPLAGEILNFAQLDTPAARAWLKAELKAHADAKKPAARERLLMAVQGLGFTRDEGARLAVLGLLPTRDGELFFRIREAVTRITRDTGGDPPVHVPEFLVPVPQAQIEDEPLP